MCTLLTKYLMILFMVALECVVNLFLQKFSAQHNPIRTKNYRAVMAYPNPQT